ncbi:arsenate reductase (glutaredoxin) [Hyphobacterium sp. CCMP332]|nr:arsenate reductase (glutaredoxin) [Hyphobacterium sp. CCMP332]
MIIYHNPRCRKSRETLEIIKSAGYNPEVYEYLKNPLSKNQLQDLLKKLNKSAEEIVRKNEAEFKENYKGKDLKESDYLNMIVKFPKLLERPIVVDENRAIIGRPPENVLSLLK